jgi:predicted MPP superfamily phosphohydrolase
MISRRQFLRSAIATSAAAGIGLVEYDLRRDWHTSNFVVEEITFAIPGLPSAFSGYTIAFLTDIHISTWVPESWLERALAELTRYKPDLLLLGGDYILVNESSVWDRVGLNRNPKYAGRPKQDIIPEIYAAFGTCVSQFSFPDGILAVVGNHEHWNRFPIFQSVMSGFPSIRVLLNEEISIRRREQELSIFGSDDYLTGLPSAPPRRELKDGIAKRVILSHNPDYLPAILGNGANEFSLALCGHTHGGQVVLPVVGPIAAQVVDRRFIQGRVSLPDGRIVYTSRGLGVVGLPFRVDCPAEVTICHLVQA